MRGEGALAALREEGMSLNYRKHVHRCVGVKSWVPALVKRKLRRLAAKRCRFEKKCGVVNPPDPTINDQLVNAHPATQAAAGAADETGDQLRAHMGSADNSARVLRAWRSFETNAPASGKVKRGDDNDGTHKQRRASLSSKRTRQLLNRAAATENLKTVAPLFSFKKYSTSSNRSPATIAAASREQATRLYNGPTVRTASTWEARHDSPGPQAYNDGEKWRDKFKNVPSASIAVAKCERDIVIPTAPGPGDYDIAHPAVGDKGNTIQFGDPAKRGRYPPRTPDQPRAQVPCSYAEHVSCLHRQVTSDKARSPTFRFNGAPRFQVRRVSS